MPRVCPERTELVIKFQKATQDYSNAVYELSKKISKADRVESSQLIAASETARVQSEFARVELEDHIKRHGCGDEVA